MNFISQIQKPYRSWFPKNLKRKITQIDSIEIDLVSHCNLNCKGCTHFSPIAEKWFIDVNDFKQDIKRVSEILPDKYVKRMYLLGGEPLLHQEINKILIISREAYKKLPIYIITNGFLLDKMDREFWDICCRYNIIIEITKYPVRFDYEKIKKLMKVHKGKVKIIYKGRTKFLKKKQYKLPLDETGSQDEIYGFTHCHMAGHCINLAHRHLYTCSYAACMDHFNNYFNKNIPVTEEDGVDIYQNFSTEEVIRKLTQPIPLCKYCAVKRRTYGNEWASSKRDITEWV